jgi:hypothetical protein
MALNLPLTAREGEKKTSAKSGERSPRFFMSALLSTTILPVEVKA